MKLFTGLFLAFRASVVAGTVSHEAGHYAAAEVLGYRPQLHFAYCTFRADPAAEAYAAWRLQNKTADSQELQNRVQDYAGKSKKDYFLITLCGPLQTVCFGTAGLLLLWFRKRKQPAATNTVTDWLLIFLSLFWLRALLNMLALLAHIPLAQGIPQHTAGDEPGLAAFFSLPPQSLSVATSLLALPVLALVLFRFIPAKERGTFVLAGICGGGAGCWLWFFEVGPFLLP